MRGHDVRRQSISLVYHLYVSNTFFFSNSNLVNFGKFEKMQSQLPPTYMKRTDLDSNTMDKRDIYGTSPHIK